MIGRGALLKATLVFAAMVPAWLAVAPVLADRLIVAKPMDHADAILVLAGSGAYAERTRKAAVLYHELVAPTILLTSDGEKSGWSQTEQRNPPFVELAQRGLREQGVPASAIEILPPEGSGTIAEARLLARVVAKRHLGSLLIVTSANHTRRALRTFESVFAAHGLETRIGIEPAGNGQSVPTSKPWWLTAAGWHDVAGEYLKSAFYYFAY